MKSSYDLKLEMQAEIAEAIKPIEEAIRARYDPLLKEAYAIEKQREDSYLDVRYASAVAEALWPIGTKLVEWENRVRSKYYQDREIPWRRTGRIGFYEIYDARKSASLVAPPSHASEMIRLARKDGTAGSKRATEWHLMARWFPEGVHPNTYEHPLAKREANRKPLVLEEGDEEE